MAQTGSATATDNASWTYAWGTGQTTREILNLVQGRYIVTVTDGNGCKDSVGVTLIDQTLPITIAVSKTSVSCFGGSDGSISLTVSGGTSPYTYAWSANAGSATTDAVSGLSAGTYTVTVTESGNSCTAVSTVTIGQPAYAPQASLTLAESSGLQANDGTVCQGDMATLTANGVPSPGGSIASYAWSPSGSSQSVTASTAGTYSVTITDSYGCTASASATLSVTPLNTAGPASSAPTVCINTALPAITHTTTGATGIGAATGLPSGVTASWASNTITISGTPVVSGTFSYSIPLSGGCGSVSAAGTITVNANKTVGAASELPTVCLNTTLTPITHATTGAMGIGTATGLPNGVMASWASNAITISGAATVSGTFNYTVPLTGGCGTVSALGTITVPALNTVGTASATPSLCINRPLTAVTHATTGATGIGTASGLPSGVTASWASNTITISGTPTALGTFNYSIPLTGGCGSVNATGTITVTSNNSVSAASSEPSLCVNTALTAITHTTMGASGIGTPTGLPAGVSASWASNTVTISGTPMESGVFSYSIPLTGGCGSATATGTITVTPENTVSAASSTPTLCINTDLTAITHTTTGATGIGTASGLPAGVSASWISNTVTISGRPT
jgi:hypothetical protein